MRESVAYPIYRHEARVSGKAICIIPRKSSLARGVSRRVSPARLARTDPRSGKLDDLCENSRVSFPEHQTALWRDL